VTCKGFSHSRFPCKELQAQTSRYATDTQAKVQRESINKPGEVERKLAEYERRLGRKLTAEEYKQEIADISAASFGARYTGQNKSYEHQKMIEDVVNDLQNVKLLRFELANRGTTPERREEINRLIDEERRKVSARFPQGQGPSGADSSASTGAPVKVTSQEQYLKIPSGTTFVAPDGSIRIKP
jgi:hypothetical protein